MPTGWLNWPRCSRSAAERCGRPAPQPLWERLPDDVRDRVTLAQDWISEAVGFDAVLHHGPADRLLLVCQQLAKRHGPIVGVTALEPSDADIPLERLVVERSLSINTAAAGGNASLMTIG